MSGRMDNIGKYISNVLTRRPFTGLGVDGQPCCWDGQPVGYVMYTGGDIRWVHVIITDKLVIIGAEVVAALSEYVETKDLEQYVKSLVMAIVKAVREYRPHLKMVVVDKALIPHLHTVASTEELTKVRLGLIQKEEE